MKKLQLVELKAGAFDHARSTLQEFLPGLDPGLTPLSPKQALLAGATLTALRRAYGAEPAEAIFRLARVTSRKPIEDAAALKLLQARDFDKLPPRRVTPAAKLWHLDEVQAEAAWNQLGGPSSISWDKVKVGQVDTGYTMHAALGFQGNTWVDIAAARTDFAQGQGPGGQGPGNGIDPLEAQMDGHGTRIASVLCGHDPNASGGAYFGIAPSVPLVPVRISNHVFISHAQRELANSLRYLVNDVGVSVINLSMGFLPRTVISDLKRAINETYEAGVIFVCAAGQPLSSVVSPAHSRRTVAVAGSTIGSVPWGKSAFGSAVDWSAPADEIHRADPSADSSTYKGGGDGTSYAAAITTGAAALWCTKHGDTLIQKYAEGWQRVEAFKAVVKATAKKMPNQKPGSFGAGIIQLDAMLNEPLPAPSSLTKEAAA